MFNFWALYIFWILIQSLMIAGKDFLLFCRLSVHSDSYFLWCTETFNLMQSHLTILALISWAIRVLLRKLLPRPLLSSMFSYSNFKVLGPMFVSLIIFELIFSPGERQGSSTCLLHVDIQFSQETVFCILCFGNFVEDLISVPA
jgi:hypothetical protein